MVEGVKLADGRAFSVQYHPEAAAARTTRTTSSTNSSS
ncbi:carbamoyl-phosphate synthase small chain domain protein [Mycobacterium avium MAV_120809_2495]|nr:carbamoyl-phosphate synthase small chain domain protein [Mycobacterium avium MAV_120809_2495]